MVPRVAIVSEKAFHLEVLAGFISILQPDYGRHMVVYMVRELAQRVVRRSPPREHVAAAAARAPLPWGCSGPRRNAVSGPTRTPCPMPPSSFVRRSTK